MSGKLPNGNWAKKAKENLRFLSLRRLLPRSLFGRSLLIIITPIVLMQVIATFMFFDRHWSKMAQRMSFAVAGEIGLVANSIEDNPTRENVEHLVKLAAQDLELLISFDKGAQIDSTKVKPFNHVWESMVGESLTKELRGQVRRPFVLEVDFQEKWVEISVQLENGVLNASVPQRRLFSSSAYIFLLWMIGSSIVLLLIAILFMRNQIRPIRKLAVAAERFGKGGDVPSFKPSGAREIRQASEAFLQMHKRIKRQIAQRTDMLAGVSHDLRTPITRLKLQMEMMGDTPDILAMKSDLAEMEKMIAGYLDFVRGEGHEQLKLVDLSGLVEKVAFDTRRRGADVTVSVEEKVQLMLRPMAFERCLTNLMNNAVRYAKHIWVAARREEGRLKITIDDDGPGIPEEEYEEVFKPFYRVDHARDTATGNVGLGLPIAMDIVYGHGGKIELARSEHGGLQVKISLPL